MIRRSQISYAKEMAGDANINLNAMGTLTFVKIKGDLQQVIFTNGGRRVYDLILLTPTRVVVHATSGLKIHRKELKPLKRGRKRSSAKKNLNS